MENFPNNLTSSLVLALNTTNGTNDTSDVIPTCNQHDVYSFRAFITSGVLMCVVICFGIPANIMNILVFTHRSMRLGSIINWYLAGLSIADLMALITGLLMFTFPIFSEWTANLSVAGRVTESMLFSYPVGLIAQTASVWLTVCVSGHRFIGVYFPYQAHRFCTKTAVKRTLIGIVVFSTLYNVTRFFELRLGKCFAPRLQDVISVILSTPLRDNEWYFSIYYTYLYMLVMLGIPFLLLIGMNSLVVASVHRSRKRHMTCDSISRKEAAKERKTTTMLLGIVFVFLFCNTLALVNNILELQGQGEPIAIDISNLLVIINASINIIVYFSFSDKYRLVCLYFLRQPWMRSKGKASEDALQLEKLLQDTYA